MVTPLSIKFSCVLRVADRSLRIAAAHPIEASKYAAPNRKRKLAQSAQLQFDRDQASRNYSKTLLISTSCSKTPKPGSAGQAQLLDALDRVLAALATQRYHTGVCKTHSSTRRPCCLVSAAYVACRDDACGTPLHDKPALSETR